MRLRVASDLGRQRKELYAERRDHIVPSAAFLAVRDETGHVEVDRQA
jgi:hypothetical protein